MALQAPVSGGLYIKATETFQNGPRKFQVTKAPEQFQPKDAQYADAEGNSVRYFFADENGNEYLLESASKGPAKAFNEANLDVNDWVEINVTGSGFKTKWTMTKIDASDQPF